MTAYRYWFIDATDAGFESSESMIAPAGKKLADLKVVKGIAGTPSNQIAIDWKGNGTPAGKREPTDTSVRDATDLRVLEFLQSPMSGTAATLEQVAASASITKAEATAALQRLKKAEKVRSPGRNQWTAVKSGSAT